MSYDENDAREEEAQNEFYEAIGAEWTKDHEHEAFEYDRATRLFTEGRLKSYYLRHPLVANPSVSCVKYAKELLPTHPMAALVFAASSVEITWKSAILVPLVFGTVHVEALAQSIAERAVPRTGGLKQLHQFLSKVLTETAAIDFSTHKRSGSTKLLKDEINLVVEARNKVLHRGEGCEPKTAELAIDVAENMLLDFFPKLLASLGLSMDGMCGVHDPDEDVF